MKSNMKQYYIVAFLFFSTILFSQEKRPEDIYQECLYNSLPDKGVELKKRIKEFENYLIQNKILNDSTSKSYYELYIKGLSDKEPKINLTYSFTDTLLTVDKWKLIGWNDRCMNKMKNAHDYKLSKLYKSQKEYDVLDNKNDFKSIFDKEDFELEFYKLRILISLNILNDIKEIKIDYTEKQLKNAISIFINSEGAIFIEKKLQNKKQLEVFIYNYVKKYKNNSLIVLNSERNLMYRIYLEIQDLIKNSIHKLKDSISIKKFGVNYQNLNLKEKNNLDVLYPLNIKEGFKEDFNFKN